jgi:hypothetical protein
MTNTQPEPGRCRICGCTDEKPCRMLPNPDMPIAGQTLVNCEWADHSRTLCTNPHCLRKARSNSCSTLAALVGVLSLRACGIRCFGFSVKMQRYARFFLGLCNLYRNECCLDKFRARNRHCSVPALITSTKMLELRLLLTPTMLLELRSSRERALCGNRGRRTQARTRHLVRLLSPIRLSRFFPPRSRVRQAAKP